MIFIIPQWAISYLIPESALQLDADFRFKNQVTFSLGIEVVTLLQQGGE